MRASSTNMCWPPRLVTVPGLHGSDGGHWQSWLERQFPRALRVEQADPDAPDLERWAHAVGERLARERGPFVVAAHSYGCLAAVHALARGACNADVAGVLLVAPASPEKFARSGALDAQRLRVPSIVVGSDTDPWMTAARARALAQRLGSAFVNLGDAGHINTAAGFGPWPRAKHFVDTLIHCAASRRFREADGADDAGDGLVARCDAVRHGHAPRIARGTGAADQLGFDTEDATAAVESVESIESSPGG